MTWPLPAIAPRSLWPGAARGPAPADPSLPGLSEVLDLQAMRERVSALVPGLETLELSYVRHKPGHSCVLYYQGHGADGRVGIPARLSRLEDHEATFQKARSVLRPSADEGAILHGVPDLGLLLMRFPHDREVRGLPHLVDAARLKRSLRRHVERYAAGRRWVKAEATSLELVTYKPERRCLVRCRLAVGESGSDILGHEMLYARAGSPGHEAGRGQQELLTALRADPRFGPRGAAVPAALGWDADHDILFLEALPGRPLLDRCMTQRFLEASSWAGEFLAKLHASPLRPSRRHDARRLLAEAGETARRLLSSGNPEAELVLVTVRCRLGHAEVDDLRHRLAVLDRRRARSTASGHDG